MVFFNEYFSKEKSYESLGNLTRKPENDLKMTNFIYTCVQTDTCVCVYTKNQKS
jgi:type VI protein secretion system component VasF